MEKYCNPQKAFTSLESHVVICKKMKSKDLTKKEWKILEKEALRLLNQAEKEYDKLPPPPGIYSKEKRFFTKVYLTYYDELSWDRIYYQKPIRDPFVKIVKRGMYGTSKEEFDNIFRMLRIHSKKFQMIKKLKHLHFTNEQEAKEKSMGELFQIIDSYLVSKYTSYMIKEFDVRIKKGKVTVKRPEYNALEAQMESFAYMKRVLEQTILISASLQDESLSEDKRNEFIKMREKSREDFNFFKMYETRRALMNSEIPGNLIKEVIGAYKNVIKVLDLYHKAFTPHLSNLEEDQSMKELSELRKILRRTDLTTEERKYFLQREAVLEEVTDWDEDMKNLVEDFPYEKDRLIKFRHKDQE